MIVTAERLPSPARRVLLVNVLIGRSNSAVASQVHGRVGRVKKRYGPISKEATVYSTPSTIYATI